MKIARENAEGNLEDQYRYLYDYKKELIRSNPRTTCEIELYSEAGLGTFKRIYVCLGGLKKGFLEGCRSVIGLDGCFLKGPVKGMILAAVKCGLLLVLWLKEKLRLVGHGFLSFC